MRTHEIIGIIKSYFYLGLLGVIVVCLLGITAYFIYRKFFGGTRSLNMKNILLWTAFIGYIIMVIGITFLGRGIYYQGSVNIHFLSSYRAAWNHYSLRGWQQLIFNIVMFLPLGILLPLLNSKMRKLKLFMATALGFTVFIETVQLITGSGVFELDDMFNNLLGALIGYGIIMSVLTTFQSKVGFQAKGGRHAKSVFYLSPLLLTIALFAGIFVAYNFKDMGNLDIAYNYIINMKNVDVTFIGEFDDGNPTVPVYRAPVFDKETGKYFAIDFFENLGIDASDMEIDQYNNNALYWIRDNPTYNIWLNYLDGSYSYTDFSTFDEDVKVIATDRENLLKHLNDFNIDIPTGAGFNRTEGDLYEWTVKSIVSGDTLTDGSVTCNYYSDDTIKRINNELITYTKVMDMPIKSELQAYKELLDGKFKYYDNGIEAKSTNKIESLDIKGVDLKYHLDTKGYYQPIYSFDSVINGKEFKIAIPAL